MSREERQIAVACSGRNALGIGQAMLLVRGLMRRKVVDYGLTGRRGVEERGLVRSTRGLSGVVKNGE